MENVLTLTIFLAGISVFRKNSHEINKMSDKFKPDFKKSNKEKLYNIMTNRNK